MPVVQDEQGLAYIGGPYGDTLYVAEPDGDFRPVHSFGLEEGRNASKQRRLLLAPDSIFVLEPADHVRFGDGDVRVRRFDRDGIQRSEEVGSGEPGPAQLVAVATQNPDNADDATLTVLGVDPETGRPLRWVRSQPRLVDWRPWTRSGVVLFTGQMTLVGVRGGVMMAWRGEDVERFRLNCGAAQMLGDRALVAGIRRNQSAVWVDGTVTELESPNIWRAFREYQGPFAVERADGSIVLLRMAGGELPSIGGAPGRLPPGIYDALLERPSGVFGLEISNEPRWVRAEL
jgi:hypothetical protein